MPDFSLHSQGRIYYVGVLLSKFRCDFGSDYNVLNFECLCGLCREFLCELVYLGQGDIINPSNIPYYALVRPLVKSNNVDHVWIIVFQFKMRNY